MRAMDASGPLRPRLPRTAAPPRRSRLRRAPRDLERQHRPAPAVVAEAATPLGRAGGGADRAGHGLPVRRPVDRPRHARRVRRRPAAQDLPRWPRCWSTPTGGSRAWAGALWGDVIAAAAPCGLAPVTGSSPTVGVTGFTLGGGVGWLSRKLGFAADNLLRVDIVTADGRLVRASADEHADLYWAVRGGGGNFGVVDGAGAPPAPGDAASTPALATFPLDARGRDARALPRVGADASPTQLTTALVLTQATRSPSAPPTSAIAPTPSARCARCGRRQARRSPQRPAPDWATPRPTTLGRHRAAAVRAVRRTCPTPCSAAAVDAATRANAVEVRYWGGAMARGSGPVGHRGVPFSITVDGPAEAALAAARDRRRLQLPQGPGPDAHRLHRGRLPAPARDQARARPRQRLQHRPQHPTGEPTWRGSSRATARRSRSIGRVKARRSSSSPGLFQHRAIDPGTAELAALLGPALHRLPLRPPGSRRQRRHRALRGRAGGRGRRRPDRAGGRLGRAVRHVLRRSAGARGGRARPRGHQAGGLRAAVHGRRGQDRAVARSWPSGSPSTSRRAAPATPSRCS